MLLIPGMEAEVNGRHLVVLGLREGDLARPGRATWDEVRALRARRPGVVVMAPHPFYPHPACLNGELNGHEDCIDAVEWCALHTHWLPSRVNPNLRAARWAAPARQDAGGLLRCARGVRGGPQRQHGGGGGSLTEEAILGRESAPGG